MHIKKLIAMLVIGCWLVMAAPTTDAAAETINVRAVAKRHHAMAGKGSIEGVVVDHRRKSVAGATVRVVHSHHHKTHSAAIKPAANAAGKVKAMAARHHHKTTTITGVGGAFVMKGMHAGSHMLKAHKKGVGSGHAMATVGGKKAARVVIRLHKHHRHHSGVKVKK